VKVIKDLQDKVKKIVEHFHRSTLASDKLMAIQRQMRPDSNPVKLKNDVVTRWNSTYLMFQRILEIQEPVEATIAVLKKPVESLSAAEWEILREVCQILRPFELVTVEISSEKSVTASKIIVLVNGLKTAINKMKTTVTSTTAEQLVTTISAEITRRFKDFELTTTLARATFLDPRFKKMGFCSDSAFTTIRDKVTNALANERTTKDANGTRVQVQQVHAAPAAIMDDDIIWGDFDRRLSTIISTPSSSAIIEVRQFLEEANIGRHEDPLLWWRGRQTVYPGLTRMARRSLCMVATSVPSERVFSKSGQLISERRTRLSAKKCENDYVSQRQFGLLLTVNIGALIVV
jgi:zinc finger BED domain-containing protein 1 (E3 SUMO-protein ligase ZBED1)